MQDTIKGLYENYCKEDKNLTLNDRAYKIFFNASNYANMKSQEEKDFFKFLKNGESSSDFTKRLEELIYTAKKNIRWRQNFMTLQQELNYRYNEGVEEGSNKKAVEDAIALLKEGLSEEVISRCINLPLEQVKKLAGEIRR